MNVMVQIKRRRPNADYASKPGDARRSGRVDGGKPGIGPVAILFRDAEGRIDALLGVIPVGYVSPNPAGGGFFWAVQLPGIRHTPRPARDADKARAALAHKIREWCEATRLVSVRR